MIGTIVCIVIVGSFKVIGSKGEEVGCDFDDISTHYSESCRTTYVEDIFKQVLRDGVIRPNELLEQLSSTCSNYEEYMKCANCTAKRVCPEEEMRLKEVLSDKWVIFCDGDQPSDWLKTILQNQYSYNRTCEYAFEWSFRTCFGDDPRANSNATSLTDISELYRDKISDTFKCTTGAVLSKMEDIKYCGSSWQDILLTGWLKFSTRRGLAVNINAEEVEQLEMMRCE